MGRLSGQEPRGGADEWKVVSIPSPMGRLSGLPVLVLAVLLSLVSIPSPMGRLSGLEGGQVDGPVHLCLNTLTDGQAVRTGDKLRDAMEDEESQYPHRWAGCPDHGTLPRRFDRHRSQYPHRWAGCPDPPVDHHWGGLAVVSIPSPMGRLSGRTASSSSTGHGTCLNTLTDGQAVRTATSKCGRNAPLQTTSAPALGYRVPSGGVILSISGSRHPPA